MLTAHGSVETAVAALKAGAADFLQKPAEFELLRAVLDRTLERRASARAIQALEQRLAGPDGAVFGDGPVMTRVLDLAARAARSDAVVLIQGESGSGKQVLAERIHAQSPRAKGPFVYVNCVALSDELIESALFGHERGAFTGAVQRKEGRLEAAQGGTAFLDEIGDTTPRLQTKLLHFLETGQYERVGGTRTLKVDCRVIAATNKDLEAAVGAGTFRQDLYYRLNVVRLEVPPLRRRPEDVAPLVAAYLARFAAELGRTAPRLAPRTAEILAGYAWPGNVRQLKNVVERLVVLAPGDVLTPDLLPPEVLAPAAPTLAPRVDLPLKEAVLEFKRAYIGRVLAEAGGNQTRAAERLGLQRTFLNRLLKDLGLRGAEAADDAGVEDDDSPR
jgi:two-component system response regulator HydG